MTKLSSSLSIEQLEKLELLKKEAALNEKKGLPHKISLFQNPRVQDALKWLEETFPNCFNLKNRVPLKIGIFEDILPLLNEDTPSKKSIRDALKVYTHHKYYLLSIKHNKPRIDLNGNIISEISPQHMEYSIEKIRQFNKKAQFSKKTKTKPLEKESKQNRSSRDDHHE